MQCSFCPNPAVHTTATRDLQSTRRTAIRRCAPCFTSELEGRFASNLADHQMISGSDVVLVCVSGEKDSTVMLHLLGRVLDRGGVPPARFVVLCVDEGISTYRTECADLVERKAADLGLEFQRRAFKSRYGHSLDDIHAGRGEGQPRMCNFCCSLRAQIVRSVGDEIGATALMTGMTLNDAAEHAFMCLLKGSFDEQGLPVHRQPGGHVKILAPLFNVSGLECGLYAYLNRVEIKNEDCLYCAEHLRDDVAAAINGLEDSNPGILHHIYAGYLGALAGTYGEIASAAE